MKILVFHDDCAIPGGTNVYRKEFSNLLRERGIEIFLFTYNLNQGEDSRRSYCYNKRCNIKFLRHLSHNYFNPHLFISLRRWINKVEPDLIHIHHNYIFTNTVLLACKSQIPTLQTVHDHRIICPTGKGFTSDLNPCLRSYGIICYRKTCFSLLDYLKEFLPRMMKRALYKRTVDTFLAPSIDLKRKMEADGLHATLLRHYIDISRYPFVPQDPAGNRVLYVGRLHEGKGIRILLEAFGKVLNQVPGATLDLVGNDEADKKFERLASSLHLDGRVTFHGLIPHSHLWEFYEKANLVVLPATSVENSPLVILEANAAGRPVIGSRIGGIPEMIIEGENGLLCVPGDPEDLSIKILQLLLDMEMAEKMGMRGRQMVETNYGPDRHLEEYLQIVQRMTGVLFPGSNPVYPNEGKYSRLASIPNQKGEVRG